MFMLAHFCVPTPSPVCIDSINTVAGGAVHNASILQCITVLQSHQ